MRDRKQTNKAGRARRDEREAVLLALLSRVRNDTFSNVLVKRTLDDCAEMSTAERAFIKRLLEGVIEREPELDARITHYTKRPVARLHPAVLQILRMGIYQILYMDAVPDSAACNESVRLAKKHAPARLSGFVNGVLRNAARDAEALRKKEKTDRAGDESVCPAGASGSGPEGKIDTGEVEEPAAGDLIADLSIRYSMPAWLTAMWADQLGEETTVRLLEALMEVRPVSVRTAPGLAVQEREKLILQLREAGAVVEKGMWLEDSLRLRRTSDLRKLPGFRQGLWTVQDESSMLAVRAAGLTGTETVYDVCAAPGGKSFYAAQLLAMTQASSESLSDQPAGLNLSEDAGKASGTDHSGPEYGGRVLSFDLTKRKTDRIREGAVRLHLTNITVKERDARLDQPAERERADVLLCDLPCSGLGVIGKKRDIKYRASREGILSLQTLQRQILKSAVRYLKPGGVMIYSTCTISREENEDNAAWIERKLGLVPDALEPYLPDEIPGLQGHMLQLLPHEHGTDGFFISRFRRPLS